MSYKPTAITPKTTEFLLRGRKAIRFVAVAIGKEVDRLTDIVTASQDEDVRADLINDIALYRSILRDMEDPR